MVQAEYEVSSKVDPINNIQTHHWTITDFWQFYIIHIPLRKHLFYSLIPRSVLGRLHLMNLSLFRHHCLPWRRTQGVSQLLKCLQNIWRFTSWHCRIVLEAIFLSFSEVLFSLLPPSIDQAETLIVSDNPLITYRHCVKLMLFQYPSAKSPVASDAYSGFCYLASLDTTSTKYNYYMTSIQ